jgi:cation transport regulator ChaB
LQEEFEQQVIEQSVSIDDKERKVIVELPFIKSPVEFLSKRHKGSDNLGQALMIYRSQCRKPEEIRAQIRAAHEDLVKKGFMVPLSSLTKEKQDMINKASFRHYYPWRAVHKPGSVSTPVRLVVDPSCTGLNIILAKGENMLSQIPDILIRLRTRRFAWTTDISKLYNQLHLHDSALPYSLFLYDSSLSDNVKPEVWVMQRAWYGVSSTGNQAAVAIKRLAEQNRMTHPMAFDLLMKDIYVDDVAGGEDAERTRDIQIKEAEHVLGSGGFSMKFVAKSGCLPPPDASADGKTVGCLGVTWDTQQDIFKPSILPSRMT